MSFKILVVDDSASDLAIIKNMLNEYCILTARDGFEAMQMLKEHDGINLLILDLNMPNMDGFQVLEMMKANDKLKRLRTIILTNYDELDNEIRGLNLGAVDYVRKPIHMHSLRARIDVHIALIRTRQEIEEALIESERSKSVLLSHLPGMAYRCNYDREWTMQFVSAGCRGLTGYSPESLINNRDKAFNDLIAPEYREALWKEWKRVLAGRLPFSYEYEIITASGERKWVLEKGQGVYNEQGEVEALEGIIIDISDRKEMEDTLKYKNEHDSLTGLLNRSYLEGLLNKDARKKNAGRRAVIGINLSDVQTLTSAYGFHYTQDLVKNIANTLNEYCTEKRMLFNTYENRFVFYIIDYKDRSELIEFCDAIVKALKDILAIERIGGGIAVMEIDRDCTLDANHLLRNLLITSEWAIETKDREFGICFYDSDIEMRIDREHEIKHDLNRVALDENNGGLYLQYQPILNLRTDRICGFEALARLNSDNLGLVPPLEFIPIAEKTKLIIPVGRIVIRKALCFLRKLKENGYDAINVSVNISVIQLLYKGFCSELFEMIDEMRVSPQNVNLEITESIFASNYQEINSILAVLKGAGINISIDDFGTGYSSLAREHELNVNCIKIDKHFINRLLSTNPKRAITEEIISIAHKFNHCTVAEGVEHEKQRQYLLNCGCDKIQGYLISKPLGEDEAIAMLKKYQETIKR